MDNKRKNAILKTVAIVGTVLTFLAFHLVLVVQMGEMRESIGEMRGDIARLDADIDDLKNDSREIRNLIVTHIIEHGGQKIAAHSNATNAPPKQ